MKTKSIKLTICIFAAIFTLFIISFTSFAKSATTNEGWHHNKTGWWYETSNGSYYKNCWKKIKGKWYYFKSNGYMASNEYIKGYFVDEKGIWDGKDKCKWVKNGSDWYYLTKKNLSFHQDDPTKGFYCWMTIDNKTYCFDETGKMYTNVYIGNNNDGWKWIGKNGLVTYAGILKKQTKSTVEDDWEIQGYKYKDTKNWIPKNKEYIFVDDFYMGRWLVKFNSNGKAIDAKDYF